MDLQQLRERGGIVPSAPVMTEVSWTHPDQNGQDVTDTFTVHVVKHSFGTVERLVLAERRDSDTSNRALLISQSIRLGDDGSESLSYEDAFQLEPRLARALLDAIYSVNGLGSDGPKA
jgi:hypothetical protein